jgi:hypothetical protein
MITEGLLVYLPAATVEALAAETWNRCGVTRWITDITTTAFHTAVGGGTDPLQSVRHVQAPDALRGEHILEVIQRHGWTTEAWRSYITDIGFARERIHHMLGGATPPPLPLPPGEPTGVHLFARP